MYYKRKFTKIIYLCRSNHPFFMKHLQIITIISLLLVSACGISRQTSAEQEQTAQAIRQMLDERHFQIDINYMIPLRGGSKSVSSYSITIDGSTIDSHLPYFGEARSVPYGGGKGLTFREEIAGYSDSGVMGREGRRIVVSVKNEEDTYLYTIYVFDNGFADVRVHSRNRDDISYRGSIVL